MTRIPTHPGALLREDVLPALRMPVSAAAQALGVSRQMLHRVLAEKSPVTAEMAVRLGKFCGDGPDIWMRMQAAGVPLDADRLDHSRRVRRAGRGCPRRRTFENRDRACRAS
jgi:addiction module HigA family antidote